MGCGRAAHPRITGVFKVTLALALYHNHRLDTAYEWSIDFGPLQHIPAARPKIVMEACTIPFAVFR